MGRSVVLMVMALTVGCRGRHHVVIDDWVPPADAGAVSAEDPEAGDDDLGAASAFAPGTGDVGAIHAVTATSPGAGDVSEEEAATDAEPGSGAEIGTVGEAGTGTDGAEAGSQAILVEVPGYGVVERLDDGAVVVPPENREQGTRPGPESAEALARALLAAIAADDPSLAMGTMFPLEAFALLKDLPDPGAYLRRMVRWYEEDVHAEREKLGSPDGLAFERLQFGYCTWQEEQSEGNVLPYWSCRHNKLYARAGTRPVTIEIHAMINWGTNWYLVHLGAVRR